MNIFLSCAVDAVNNAEAMPSVMAESQAVVCVVIFIVEASWIDPFGNLKYIYGQDFPAFMSGSNRSMFLACKVSFISYYKWRHLATSKKKVETLPNHNLF